MKPTLEQEAILSRAKEDEANLIINARAGAAKTTTLCLLTEALTPKPVLVLAFNKKVAEELQTRLPANAKAQTLNSIGHRAWGSYVGKRLSVDGAKVRGLLREGIEQFATTAEAEDLQEHFTDLLDVVRLAKTAGYLPEGTNKNARPLIEDDSFFDLADVKLTGLERQIITWVVDQNFRHAIGGYIDFDDQIYLPAIMPVSFDSYPVTMVDEAQDLSAINHAMLRKIVRKKRLIAVGDPCQAIYGFRGASENSMAELRQMFQMEELYLTICFRSAQSIVEHARWRAPDMQWRPNAPMGLISLNHGPWGPEDLLPGDAIICRNNAPLFRMAIELLRKGMSPELLSGDIVKALLAIMKKLGKSNTPAKEALALLERWHQKELTRVKAKGALADKVECIQMFLEDTKTLGEAADALDRIANMPGRIKLMTGHKSKGLEFDRVWFLDPQLLKVEESGQDKNVKYVIETRAKSELRVVLTEMWDRPKPREEKPLPLMVDEEGEIIEELPLLDMGD